MSDEQREIGAILIEINNRNVDRFFSLIELAVVILALYAAIVIYKPGILKSLENVEWNLLFCILSIILAVKYSILEIQKSGNITTLFKKNGELIQYKNEQELLEQNKLLFSSIYIQNDTIISSIVLLICSLGFSYNYLLPEKYHICQDILYWALFTLFVVSISFKHYGKNLKTLYRRLKCEIIGYTSLLLFTVY